VAADGVNVFAIDPSDTASYGLCTGTSFSTPLIAGTVSLIVSAFPEVPTYKIRDALQKSATQAYKPDSVLGYGLPDIIKTFKLLGIAIAPISYYKVNNLIRTITNIVSEPLITDISLNIKFNDANIFKNYPMKPTFIPEQYYCDVPISDFNDSNGYCFIQCSNNQNNKRMPYNTDSLIKIDPNNEFIQCGINPAEMIHNSFFSTVNYVYPNVLANNERFCTVNISIMEKTDIDLTLYSYLGEKINTVIYQSVQPGMFSGSFPIPNISTGSYYIRFSAGVLSGTLPIIIIN
jgi:hypothetical protein